MILLRLIARQLPTRIVAALLALAVCGGTVGWAHAGGDDPACASALVQHDQSAHRITTESHSGTSPADHCTLCHLLRLLQAALAAKSTYTGAAWRVEPRRASDGVLALALFTITLSSRGPPPVQG